MGHVLVEPRKLTLSEGGGSGREDVRVGWLLPEDRGAADRFADLLALADISRTRGYDDLAAEYTERIVAEVCPDTDGPGHGRAA